MDYDRYTKVDTCKILTRLRTVVELRIDLTNVISGLLKIPKMRRTLNLRQTVTMICSKQFARKLFFRNRNTYRICEEARLLEAIDTGTASHLVDKFFNIKVAV